MRLQWTVSVGLALFLCLLLAHQLRGDESDLVWSTFLGGSDYDLGYGIAVDDAGDVYVTGVVTSEDFPKKSGILDTTHGGRDLLVAKIYAAGDSLAYATLLGGSEDDEGKGIHVDGEGNVYVAGVTNSDDFPTTPGVFDTSYNGFREVVLAKLDPTGTLLEYSTFLGGSGSDWGKGLAVDDGGDAYVVGYTNSEDFPITSGAFDASYNGGYWDFFVAKFNSKGNILEYSTFLGGEDIDDAQDVALDGSGSVYVTGHTLSSDFPTTPGAYDTTHNGGYDVFMVKLNPTGKSLAYSTFLGGAQADYGFGIAVDDSGNAHVTGKTVSADFPTTAGAYDTSSGGGYHADGFVVKFDPTGGALEYSTFLGGSEADEGHGIALDSSGSSHVVGRTWSEDFPTTPDAYSTSHSGYYSDVFAVKLNSMGSSLVYGTFLGGSRDDLGWSIAVDGDCNAYVTGETKSPDFPTTEGAYSTALIGDYADVFVAKLNVGVTSVGSETPMANLPSSCALHQNHPNPFNAITEIRYQIPENGHVALKIFNTLGQEVRSLVDEYQLAGEHSVTWDGRDDLGRGVASGVYFCRLIVGDYSKTVKMVHLQ